MKALLKGDLELLATVDKEAEVKRLDLGASRDLCTNSQRHRLLLNFEITPLANVASASKPLCTPYSLLSCSKLGKKALDPYYLQMDDDTIVFFGMRESHRAYMSMDGDGSDRISLRSMDQDIVNNHQFTSQFLK
ncbi:hypothetical protein VNO78_24155 [Psophocarpus tetragonolobus]|uniref:Uncharacterized protein n=1 Tax=Psophocarpus tetragonolobus TaxID=3891 RepID=A0AAN9S4V6_PSOTE